MKNVYFLFAVLCFLGGELTAHAQIDLEDITKAAQQYNEKVGESQSEQQQSKTDSQKKKEEQWKKEWEAAKEAASEGMDYFDTQELNCLFLMVLYLDSYFKLEDAAEAEASCQLKYDLYGTQAASIALSTTIMYCPEHLHNLSDAEMKDFVDNKLVPLLIAHDAKMELPDIVVKLIDKYLKVGERLGEISDAVAPNPNEQPDEYEAYKNRPDWQAIRDLTFFFSPKYVVLKSLELGRKMEALGCGDY